MKPIYWKITEDIAENKWGQHGLHEAVVAVSRCVVEMNRRLVAFGWQQDADHKALGLSPYEGGKK